MELLGYKFDFKELNIDAGIILRTMGYEADSSGYFADLTNEMLVKIGSLAQIEGGIAVFDEFRAEAKSTSFLIDGTAVHPGKLIFNYLKESEKAALFVCTVGKKIDELIHQLFKEGKPVEGYIADIIGSATVEAAVDKMQESLKNKMLQKGLFITNRYSPGYCGWMLKEQKSVFSLLPEGYCNINLSDSCLMQPIKSVSGLMGIGAHVKQKPYSCQICDLSKCLYRGRKF